MDTEYLVINDGSKRKEVEDLRAILPDVEAAVLPQALVIKAVDLCDLP